MGSPKMFENVTFMQNTDTLRSQILLIMIYWFYHGISVTYHFLSQTVCKPVITLKENIFFLPYFDPSLVIFVSPFQNFVLTLGGWAMVIFNIFFSHSTIFHEASTKAGQAF